MFSFTLRRAMMHSARLLARPVLGRVSVRTCTEFAPVYSVSAPRFSTMFGGPSDELLVSLSMNYNNSGSSHTELCDNLKKNHILNTPLLEYAFRKCDRSFFDPSSFPYEDKPHEIGAGATISSAHMHCIALEALADCIIPPVSTAPTPVRSFLDVGSGSGYVVGIFSSVIAALRANPVSTQNANLSGVVGIELHPALAEQSLDNLTTMNPDFTQGSDAIARIIANDAFGNELLPNAPFDAIHCGVASTQVPYTLLAQLKPEGKIVIPVVRPGSQEQDLVVFCRRATSTIGTIDFISEASKVTEDTAQAFLDTHFNKRVVMRCIYSLAQDSEANLSSIPSLNPRQTRAPQAPGKYSKFFKGGEASEEQQAAYEKYLLAQKKALEEMVERLRGELAHKERELEKTADEVKLWHEAYMLNHRRRPSLTEMGEDPHQSTLLRLVKELRLEVTKSQRALAAAESQVKKA